MKVGDLHRELGEMLGDPDVYDDEVLVATDDGQGGIKYVPLVSLEEMSYREENGEVQVLAFGDLGERDSDSRAIVLWHKA